jgi:hypothetical protein
MRVILSLAAMFSSGMNVTQSSLDELAKAGLIKEITRQADGKEFELHDSGEPIAFSQLGDGIDQDELDRAVPTNGKGGRPKIPFLDTNSPWHKTVPVQFDEATNKTYVQQIRKFTRASFAQDSASKGILDRSLKGAVDPIDLLTVKRLKEILKSRGLKLTGTKKELQNRLRIQVNALLQGNQDVEIS